MGNSDFETFLEQLTHSYTRVLDMDLQEEDYIGIDLSENNNMLKSIDLSSSGAFQGYIDDFLKKSGKKVAFGGYNEVRKLYMRSELFGSSEVDERNIHIGLDLWAPAGTGVLAVLDGKIHSFQDNANFGDYGPTIILEHENSGRKFYSLYGHLSRASLNNLKPGMPIKKAEKIGELGTAEENGDYAPHLHFQIIEKLEEKPGDFPGVTSRKELDFYLRNCPDPNLLLKLRLQ